jgi:ribosomal protein L20
MSNQQPEISGKKARKEFRKLIITRLNAVLAEYKSAAGEKTFVAALKKTAKNLSRELMPKNNKKEKLKEKKKTRVPETISME